MRRDRIVGSVLALALGDAFGAPHEGGIVERLLWSVIGKRQGKRRWTDDTQMTLDLIESLVACGGLDQDDLATRFARSYRWSRGYGPGTARVLKRIRRGQPWEEARRAVYPEGSFGNGGAMRAPAVGLLFSPEREDELIHAASATAAVTHAHPLGRGGAQLIALATALGLQDAGPPQIIGRLVRCARSPEFSDRLRIARTWLREEDTVCSKEVADKLGNGITAPRSCVTSVYAALAFRDRAFEDLLRYIIELGGDVDTIAAMAGAIWGAAHGKEALPESHLKQLDRQKEVEHAARSLAKAAAHHHQKET
jgi:ADP-ribosylglycohydrolase